jgi:hypothetical protein
MTTSGSNATFSGLVSGVTPISAANFVTKAYADGLTPGSGVFLPLIGGTMTGNTIHNDNVKSIYGTASDGLEIYHDGSNSYINDTGTGSLYVGTNDFRVTNAAGTENLIRALANDTVILYNNNIEKFRTTGPGATVTGQLTVSNGIEMIAGNFNAGDNEKIRLGNSADFQIYHDGSNSYIQNETGNLTIFNKQDDGDVIFANDNGSGGTATYFRLDGGQVETVVFKDFNFEDNVKAKFGSSADLQIYHDGSNSYIQDTGTGTLNLQGSTQVLIAGMNGQVGVQFIEGGKVGLRHANAEKLVTNATGIQVTGNIDEKKIFAVYEAREKIKDKI